MSRSSYVCESNFNQPHDYFDIDCVFCEYEKLKTENAALIAERDELKKSEAFLKDSIDTSINDTRYYETKYLDAKKDYEECSQAVFWLGKERDALQARIDGGSRVRIEHLAYHGMMVDYDVSEDRANATLIMDGEL